jgi:excisionase family DNA binding protein
MEKSVNYENGKNYELKGKGNYQGNQLKEILTIQEVADFLRIHRTTVTRLAKSGEIKSYKLGNRRLFLHNEVIEFFENLVDLQYVLVKEI